MSKPNWSDAPAWAQYLAQDESGAWYWFEGRPKAASYRNWHCVHGDCEEAKAEDNWQ